jgi:hypothetical protein
MSVPREAPAGDLPHALNNLFAKILGAAELALDHPSHPRIRYELETILCLAEEGGGLIRQLTAPRRAP